MVEKGEFGSETFTGEMKMVRSVNDSQVTVKGLMDVTSWYPDDVTPIYPETTPTVPRDGRSTVDVL